MIADFYFPLSDLKLAEKSMELGCEKNRVCVHTYLSCIRRRVCRSCHENPRAGGNEKEETGCMHFANQILSRILNERLRVPSGSDPFDAASSEREMK